MGFGLLSGGATLSAHRREDYAKPPTSSGSGESREEREEREFREERGDVVG